LKLLCRILRTFVAVSAGSGSAGGLTFSVMFRMSSADAHLDITILIVLHLQNQLETHYSGFKTPHIYNLSDLVQQNLALQVC